MKNSNLHRSFFIYHKGNIMLSQVTVKIKYLTQKNYNKYLYLLNFSTCKCSCGATGRFVMHGYYKRSIKIPLGKIALSILRVKCKSCGKTHAILHPSIIPYSQIPLCDTIEIIDAYENNNSFTNILNNNPDITESDVRYTIKRYLKCWKDRILSISTIPILDFILLADFQKKVSDYFFRAFMQIKCGFYQLF